ncbi:MAG: nitroreductase family protein, partial [Nitrososphaeria archaeon]
MEFEEVIKKRRSIRAFEKRKVEKEKVDKILSLVNLAPSAGNLQAYKVFVVKNEEKIKEIAHATYGMGHFKNLPPLILIFCANPAESSSRYGERGRTLYAFQDATIACVFAHLTVASLGLGSCWVGAFDEEKVKEILKTDL